MCQLLGMNCNVPTDVCFSFAGFQARGGLTDHHQDGWGIAFFEGKGVRVFVDPMASSTSPVAQLVKEYPIHSLNVIAHIRKATQGVVLLENTHPFVRELWGKYWVFAHNGNLLNFEPESWGRFKPVGSTDSEKAFCWIMNHFEQKFIQEPSPQEFYQLLRQLSIKLSQFGEFNFLLSNGEYMFAHASSKLCYIIRQSPFTVAHLKDQDMKIDFSKVASPDDRVAIITTAPLTDNEVWQSIESGTLLAFYRGEIVNLGESDTCAFQALIQE